MYSYDHNLLSVIEQLTVDTNYLLLEYEIHVPTPRVLTRLENDLSGAVIVAEPPKARSFAIA